MSLKFAGHVARSSGLFRLIRQSVLRGTPGGLFFIGMMVLIGLASCGKVNSGANSGTSAGDGGDADAGAFRIVSLSPAITDILLDLGLGEYVVGRGAWEEQLGAEIPRVGDLSNLDLEGLIALGPTDVILQAGRRGTPAAQHRGSGRIPRALQPARALA